MKSLLMIPMLLTLELSGQNLPEKEFDPARKNKILFAPFNLFDVINPSTQIGYERRINDKFCIQGEVGLINKRSVFGMLLHNEYWWTSYGYKLRAECKYLLKERTDNFKHPYFSAEVFYTETNSNVWDMFIIADTTFQYSWGAPPDSSFNGYEEFFTVHRERIGFNLKYGFEMTISDLWFVEMYGGIGIVYRTVTNGNRENLNDSFYDKSWINANVPGRYWRLNVPINIKVGFRF